MADVKPPKGSTGDVGGRTAPFYIAVLKAVGAPVTQTNLNILQAWQAAEGGTAAFNPFNTTRDSKAAGQTNYNTFGQGYHVKNYPTFDVGVSTTVATLRNYPGVIAGLRVQDPAVFTNALVNSKWSAGYHAKGKIGSRDYRQSSVWKAYQRISGEGGAGSSVAMAGNVAPVSYTAQNAFSVVGGFNNLIGTITNPAFWVRAFEMTAGAAVILYGLVILATGTANIDWQKVAGLVVTKGKSAAATAA